MRDALVIPDSAIKYMLFQRGYLRLLVTPLYRLFDQVLPFQTPPLQPGGCPWSHGLGRRGLRPAMPPICVTSMTPF